MHSLKSKINHRVTTCMPPVANKERQINDTNAYYLSHVTLYTVNVNLHVKNLLNRFDICRSRKVQEPHIVTSRCHNSFILIMSLL